MTSALEWPLADAPALIERLFPVAKLSAESFKERNSGAAQRLTGVGRWWGRKPLVLVRASILGALLPATDDPQKDLEVFERLLGLDDVSLHQRSGLSTAQFTASSSEQRRKDSRPAESFEGPTDWASWMMINDHLGTNAFSLPELVQELGLRRFGSRLRVGDVFAGGGSVPFEAARLGCDTYASDLSPVAGLLTWSNHALLCAAPADRRRIDAAQQWVYEEADRQITEWGIEHDAQGRRADAFLWCTEVVDPETGYVVPLSTTWVISTRERVIAELVPDPLQRRYDIRIVMDASDEQVRAAKQGTVVAGHLVPPPTPDCPEPQRTLLSRLRTRHDAGRGLRPWTGDDLTPAPGDFLQERLYCVRWTKDVRVGRRVQSVKIYEAVTAADLDREAKCLTLLRERFEAWQAQGFIPEQAIHVGNRRQAYLPSVRGWTHWHHLFTPRQLLIGGLLAETAELSGAAKELLGFAGKVADRSSKFCVWSNATNAPAATFTSHLLAPVYNWSARGLRLYRSLSLPTSSMPSAAPQVELRDARAVDTPCSLWLTDPPYGDAIPYEDLSAFFLAWYGKRLTRHFPEWYGDPKRALAMQGKDAAFNTAMIEVYANLARLMPENGLQIVMFTHRDVRLWADLAMIMWASGLKVTAAWTVSTETENRAAGANAVQSTVLLVLRQRGEVDILFEDEVLALMEAEVSRQLADMQRLEDTGLTWSDADLQLATYAAALRVITAHDIDGIEPHRELLKVRAKGEKSPVHHLIEQASQVASRHLLPHGLDPNLWHDLGAHERFYLKGLEAERRAGERRTATYQELSKGFAANAWPELISERRGQDAWLLTASGMGGRGLNTGPLAGTLLRHVLMGVKLTTQTGQPEKGLAWLQQEVRNFDMQHTKAINLLEYLGKQPLPHWSADAQAARLLRGALMNAGV
ncbi:DUF1156 domain-containing protein [Deinococcus daejeonensis]|uniref:DNA methylase n=1 Tax=Deinococcus daejeonensis TaxID=1007098 RepID=A0ABQ2J264_9DEIO|nr:DUF1156 domain-containing protein [Deinococcus daejeonensis]GGN34677.1 DNA methylase [Deinococcus daejeonensis]